MNCTHSTDLQNASQLHPYHALCSWIKGLRIHYRFKTLLWTLADKYGEDGLVFPSVKTLAREINVSRSTVHRWLNELETAGLVTRKHRYRTSDGGQTSSYYVLNCDTPVAAVTRQEHQSNTYVLHARRAEDVIYMELEEDENPETSQTVGVLAKEGLEPPTREKGLPTGFDPRQGVRGDEGVEPQTREVSHPSHQISNLALPTTQPSNPKPLGIEPKKALSPKVTSLEVSAIEPEMEPHSAKRNYQRRRFSKSSVLDNTAIEPTEKSIQRGNPPRKENGFTERGLDSTRRPRVNEPRELPSRSNPRDKQRRKTPRRYRIQADRMVNLEYAIMNYQAMVKQKWVSSGERDRLSWFSCWTKCVRQWREGKVKEPGALLVSIIKKGLLHKFPADEDEQKTLKILRYAKANGDIS